MSGCCTKGDYCTFSHNWKDKPDMVCGRLHMQNLIYRLYMYIPIICDLSCVYVYQREGEGEKERMCAFVCLMVCAPVPISHAGSTLKVTVPMGAAVAMIT